jgi:hypothetical protein
MIEHYSFGSITIDGKTYNHDVEVRWSGEVLKWQRAESHIIDAEDVKRAVAKKPETIIIGTGASGVARVTEAAQKFITQEGIKLIIDVTEQAIKSFNIIKNASLEEEGRENKVIGLFHLTC